MLNFNKLKELNSKKESEAIKQVETFNEENHEYKKDDKVVKSVTQIIQELGLSGDFSKVSDFYAKRGTALHKAIELYHSDNLDADSLHPEIKPFFEQFLKFKEENKTYESLEQEKRFFTNNDDGYNYAGTIDDIANINDSKCIIDYKTCSSIAPYHYLQIAAYCSAQNISKGYILQIRDKFYKLIEVPVKQYVQKWDSLLALYFSEIDEKDKLEKARLIYKDQIDMKELRAKTIIDKLIKAQLKGSEIKEELSELKTELNEKLEINGVKYNGIYEDEKNKVIYTQKSESVRTSYDINLLLIEHPELLEIIDQYKKETVIPSSYMLKITEKKQPQKDKKETGTDPQKEKNTEKHAHDEHTKNDTFEIGENITSAMRSKFVIEVNSFFGKDSCAISGNKLELKKEVAEFIKVSGVEMNFTKNYNLSCVIEKIAQAKEKQPQIEF